MREQFDHMTFGYLNLFLWHSGKYPLWIYASYVLVLSNLWSWVSFFKIHFSNTLMWLGLILLGEAPKSKLQDLNSERMEGSLVLVLLSENITTHVYDKNAFGVCV